MLMDTRHSVRLIIMLELVLSACAKPRQENAAKLQAADVPLRFYDGTYGADFFASGRVILQDGAFSVRADIPAVHSYSVDESPFYYATFSNPIVMESVKAGGDVLYQGNGRAVVRIASENDVMKVSEALHTYGGAACGGLVRIPLTEVSEPISFYNGIESAPVKKDEIVQLVQRVNPNNIKATIEKMQSLGNRFHSSPTGKQVAEWAKAEGYGKSARAGVSIEFFKHKSTPQPSVIARIEGKKEPQKIVIVGSHLDSINQSNSSAMDQKAPGADDNASGTSTALETFRIVMESGVSFDYTVEFHSYAAEEMGLWGSQEIAENYKSQGKQVVAMMQLDMTGWMEPSSGKKLWLVSNSTSRGLNTMLGKLIDLYIGLPWGQEPLSAGSSDHASWTRAGFPAAFPFERPSNSNPHIHTSRDTIDQLDMDYAGQFSKLALAYLGHVAGIQGGAAVQPPPPVNPNLPVGLISLHPEATDDRLSLLAGVPLETSEVFLCRGLLAQCATLRKDLIFRRSELPSTERLIFAAESPWDVAAGGEQATLFFVSKSGETKSQQIQFVRK